MKIKYKIYHYIIILDENYKYKNEYIVSGVGAYDDYKINNQYFVVFEKDYINSDYEISCRFALLDNHNKKEYNKCIKKVKINIKNYIQKEIEKEMEKIDNLNIFLNTKFNHELRKDKLKNILKNENNKNK